MLLAGVLVTLAACRRPLSENERKVVGTWDRTGMDFTERTVFRPDRTMESEMSDGSGTRPFAKGTWHVENNVLVAEYTVHWEPIPGETPFPKQIIRTPILEFQPDKLLREKGRPSLVRVK
jgi:hypothetical protein